MTRSHGYQADARERLSNRPEPILERVGFQLVRKRELNRIRDQLAGNWGTPSESLVTTRGMSVCGCPGNPAFDPEEPFDLRRNEGQPSELDCRSQMICDRRLLGQCRR